MATRCFALILCLYFPAFTLGQLQTIKPSCNPYKDSSQNRWDLHDVHECPVCQQRLQGERQATLGENDSGYGQVSALFPAYIDGVLTLGNGSGESPYDLDDTFLLESRPSASKTIYLDYNGHHSFNNFWEHDIVFEPFDLDDDPSQFSDEEKIRIQLHFQNVAEDFLPFDVNVTTKDPGDEAIKRTSEEDDEYGVRILNTQPAGGFGNGIGGIAFVGTFPYVLPEGFNDAPAFAFNRSVINGALTISHEAGHTLSLYHHGLNGSSYHPGTGDADTNPVGWGPIMGAPWNTSLIQWSDGTYAGATNLQDDLAIITQTNGFDYRDDDVSDSVELQFDDAGFAFDWGIIERSWDSDEYSINVDRGILEIRCIPFRGNPNLDIQATLYDAAGSPLAVSNPEDDIDAYFSLEVDKPSEFTVSIEGIGLADVYTDYASLGFYTIESAIKSLCVVGDVNMDEEVDLQDVAPFIDALMDQSYVCEADVNQDGVVDLLDVTPLVELLTGG